MLLIPREDRLPVPTYDWLHVPMITEPFMPNLPNRQEILTMLYDRYMGTVYARWNNPIDGYTSDMDRAIPFRDAFIGFVENRWPYNGYRPV